jgi:predicted SAM-dependent methyltransferase
MLKLHVGCGTKRKEGYVNCDISKDVNPDVVVDICNLSKKFKKYSVDEIFTEHTIEHVGNFEKAMSEIHEVLKTGDKAYIVVPYATIPSAFHPHHKWYFTKESFMSPVANRLTWLYENSGLAWIFPAKELHTELTK